MCIDNLCRVLLEVSFRWLASFLGGIVEQLGESILELAHGWWSALALLRPLVATSSLRVILVEHQCNPQLGRNSMALGLAAAASPRFWP